MTWKKSKSMIALLLIVALVFSLMPTETFAEIDAGTFTTSDIDGHWAQGAIETCHGYDVMNGYPDGSYKPDENITRAEFAAMVNRAFGYDALTVPPLDGYRDVPSNQWYAADMSVAIVLTYIAGYGNGIAAPEDQITREQAAVMLTKILRLTPMTDDTFTNYTDINQAAGWSKPAILTMEQKGYMVGYNNRFMPKNNLTRGGVEHSGSARTYL